MGASPGRVLFVANDPPGRAVYRYRCENIADVLRGMGWQADVVWVGDRNVRVEHDVVVLHRICAVAEGREYARAARACGAVLVYGTDDLVFDARAFPADDTSAATAKLRRYAPLHAAMAEMADAVLVSTEFLADEARRQFGGKPVFTVRNFLSPKLLALSDPVFNHSRNCRHGWGDIFMLRLVYMSGTPTHDADLATIADPLRELILRPKSDVKLHLIGPVTLPPALADLPSRNIEFKPFMPWEALPAEFTGINVNLAPLDLTRRLNQGKSEIKLLEAAAAGVVTVASAGAGFLEAWEIDRRAGLLASTPNGWSQCFNLLFDEIDERFDAGERARAYVHAHGTAAANRQHIANTFAQLMQMPRAASTATQRAQVVGSPLSPKHLVKTALGHLRGGGS